MKVLVTGAKGQLGCSIQDLSPDNFIYTDIEELDITDLQAVRTLVAREKVEAIVNCAGFTNVEAAEDNYNLAELLNATATQNLAIAMKEVGGLLLHISTDYVFGKEPYNTPCKEDRKGTPTGVYGLTKLHGEEAILRSGVRHIIIRTSWLYSPYGKNFVKTMLELTAKRPVLNVVFDQVGTPTYAGDLAAAIIRILEAPVEGIFNYSNEGVCSWYDFAKAISQLSGHTSCQIKPCHSWEFPSKVHRPAYSVLDKTLVKETFGLSIPYWTDSLRECLSKML
ncbi:MAG: dTDP-4-dehydrorhamnose reductase [Bacteroidales bacterium]|nr:dTDP-4-dehydrorhamnose reductase [Bacteroidales bacterium]